jgi:predicted lysophospholipase L1 biosynthesis ABC-type transport system permease subunit
MQHRDQVIAAKTDQARKRHRVLMGAYFARAVSTIALSAASISTAIAIAKPLFEYWANTTNNNLNRRMLIRISKVSGTLGSQIARLMLARIVLGAFWVGLALTVIIAIIDDDALERWCQHCCYRFDPSRKLLKDEKELSELFSALSEIL